MVEDRFTALLAKKLAGELTPEEATEFNNLLANNNAYNREYEALKAYWQQDEQPYANAATIFNRIKQQTDIHQREAEHSTGANRSKKLTIWLSAAAAVFLLAISVFVYQSHLSKSGFKVNQLTLKQLQTPSGTISKITLPDGTHITLNAESSVRYPASFAGNTREVFLDGEGFFDVKHDAQHPFIVHTAKFDIKVLGTAFDIKCYNADSTNAATLLRGSIQLMPHNSKKTTLLMKPHDKVVLNGLKYQLTRQTYNAADSSCVETAWLNNKLSFRDQTFYHLANDLSRHFGVSIKFQNSTLKSFTFTGDFERENLNQILSSLQVVKPFRYSLKDNTVVIY